MASSSGTHATDPIGARDVDAEAQGRLRNEGDREPNAPQREGRPLTVQEGNTVVQDMLECVRTFELTTIPRPEVSTFVPCFQMMYYVIYQMDELMIMNRYFQSKWIRWNPLLTRIYFGTLAIIQCIRVMVKYGNASMAQRRFLREFEDSFSYQDLSIAGPLVPFFKALCASPPSKGNYGPIIPFIPDALGLTDASNHATAPQYRTLLPNLVGLRRAYNGFTAVRPAGAADTNWRGKMHNSAGPIVPPAHGAANVQSRDAYVMPGSTYDTPWNYRNWQQWHDTPNKITVPNVTPNAGVLGFSTYLGLDGNFGWFSSLSGLMNEYCKYWKGKTSMHSLSLYDGNHNQITIRYVHDYDNRDDHRDNDNGMFFIARASSPGQDFDNLAVRLAAFTQINAVTADNFDPEGDFGGRIGTTRNGEFWNQNPNEVDSVDYNPSIAVPTMLSNVHHDRPKESIAIR